MPFMDVSVCDILYGDVLTVNVVLPGDASGIVLFAVNGVNYTAEVVNGCAVGVISGLDIGEYVISVYYLGDDKYNSASVGAVVTVFDKLDSVITVDDLVVRLLLLLS